MAKLSETALLTLMALASANDMIVRSCGWAEGGREWHYSVMPRDGVARFNVPIHVFGKMHREGLLTRSGERVVGKLVFGEYVLTDAGRAALAAA